MVINCGFDNNKIFVFDNITYNDIKQFIFMEGKVNIFILHNINYRVIVIV